MDDPILRAFDLVKVYAGRRSLIDRIRRQPVPQTHALDNVAISVHRGETVGLVGESGSGKTTLARCLVRLVEPTAGSILFDGTDVRTADRHALRAIRRRVQIIYQDPYSSLNPRLTVGDTIGEAARVHNVVEPGQVKARVGELLERVGLAPTLTSRKPRELSGGQRQRVAIARALVVEPDVLIADEAVSALDVSVQAQILNLFEELGRELQLAMIVISHQLAVVAHISQRVSIMQLGRIVEEGPTAEVFRSPRNPYTAALLEAHPKIEPGRRRARSALRGEISSSRPGEGMSPSVPLPLRD